MAGFGLFWSDLRLRVGTRLFIPETHLNHLGNVSVSLLSGNGCWAHIKQGLKEKRKGRGAVFW